MRLHYRGDPFPLDALRKELTEAARARADAARMEMANASAP